ncbi:hypothetical protein T492DRAFT_850881 [Pavlovales sp. CCMP2436]|nr:hypothetical protein T492DRAFT_850881 [Pavlovales sp. CCMP2436]
MNCNQSQQGWVCVERGLNSVSVRVHGELRTFEVLANNDFTPSRKRMSVLLREDMRANEAREAKEGGEGGHLSGVPLRSPHGARYRYLVAAKGADDAMLELGRHFSK